MMRRTSLEFLRWLVAQQQVSLGTPESRELTQRAFEALDDIEAELASVVETG